MQLRRKKLKVKKINETITRLFRDMEYCHVGAILQCMNIKITDQIPTAGVNYDKKLKKFNLYVNESFFDKITADQRTGVMIHEIDHILHRHVFMDIKKSDMPTWNIAMDLVINQGNNRLPDSAMFIKNFKDESGATFEANKPTEYYYNKLVNEDSQIKTSGEGQGENENQDGEGSSSGGGKGQEKWEDFKEWMKARQGQQVTLDAHDWENSAGEDEKEALEAMKDLMRSARKRVEAFDRSAGALNDILEEIDSKIAKLDFKSVLASAIRKSVPANDFSRTYSRPNRRLGYKAAGKRTQMLPRIDFLVDTSGSIDMETLNMFTEVTQGFLGMVSSAKVHLFHTETYKTMKVKKGYKIEQNDVQCGGTDLTDSFEKLIKSGSDLVVILTDGYFCEPEVDLKKMPKIVVITDTRGNTQHPLTAMAKTYVYEPLN